MIATLFERFSRSLRPSEDLPLRVQMFRLVCVVVAVLCLGVVVPANLLQNLPQEVNLGVALLGVVGAYFHWRSCRGRHHVAFLLFITVVMLDLIWFWNAGSQGSLTYYFFPVLLYILGLFRGRLRWILTLGLVLNIVALFILERHFPAWVTPFQSEADRFVDHVTGVFCSIAMATGIAAVILASYDREQVRIKQIAAKLTTSEQTYREIFNSTSDALFIYDLDGRVLDFNDRACALFGFDRKTGLALSIGDISLGSSPYSKIEMTPKLAQARAGTPQTFEWRSRRRDGSLFWAEVALRACQIGGQPRLISAMRDITDRKEAQEAVRQNEERLRLAMTATAQGWYEMNIQSGEGTSSPEYLHIIGEDPATFRTTIQSWLQGIHPDDRERMVQSYHDCIASGETRTQEYRRQTKSGAWKWIRSVGKVVEYDPAGKPLRMCGTHTDITERKDLEMRLLQSQRLEAVGTLAGGVAHDLNNILTPLLLAINLLREKLTDPEDHELVAMLESGAKRGIGIVKQLAAFSGGQTEHRVPVAPLDLLRETSQLLRPTLPDTITVVEPTSPPQGSVLGNPTQLHQALMNLCVNARDAMPTGGTLTLGLSRTELPPAARDQTDAPTGGPYLVLAVSDTGHGIAPENVARIFDPFFTTKKVGRGTGLGLASVHGIVKSHHGFVRVESTPGQGATFTIFLPAIAEAPPTPATPALPPARTKTGRGECILVVDDEETVRKVTCRRLEREGYRVLTAASGPEALQILRDNTAAVQAVITDFLMPEMDGPTLVPLLREIVPGLNIIGVSGNDQSSRSAELKQLGFAEIIAKPYVDDVLLQAVRRQLPKSP